MRFDGIEGFVRLDSPGYSSSAGVIEVDSDRFRISSSQPLTWSAVDTGWCTHTPFLILRVLNSTLGLRVEVENHTDSEIKLKDVRISFPPESFSPVPDAREHVQYTNPIAPVFGERLMFSDSQVLDNGVMTAFCQATKSVGGETSGSLRLRWSWL